MSSWRRWVPYAFLSVMLVVSAICGVLATRMVQTGNINPVTTAVTFFVPTPQSVFGRDRLYVLLLGIDYNYDNKDQEYSTQARSDTIMAAGIDFPSKSVRIVSIPRDMSAVIHGEDDKINGAFASGGEPYADEVIGSWLGLPKNDRNVYFDRYIVLKINATKELVDAIGGIDVPVAEQMDYDDSWGHLHIHFKPGLTHMNGEQAVSYSRFRHDACSDPCRIKRQQQVLQITVAKLKADKFNDLAHISALIGVINRNVSTNLTDNEKRSLAWHFRDINLADLKAGQIAYVDTKQTASGEALIPDEKQKAQAVAMLTGAYAAQTPAPPPGPAASIAPSRVHIAVQNGSGESGLGGKMAEQLRQRGFVVDSVANADTFSYETTVIHEHSKTAGVGELVRLKLGMKTAAVTPQPNPSPSAAARSRAHGCHRDRRARFCGRVRRGPGKDAAIGRRLAAFGVVALMLAAVGYGSFRLWRRTDALGAPAIITPAMDVHRLLSPSLAVRWNRLVHGNAPPAGPRPRLIALTFDDGPYPVETPLLLDTLDELHVPATFFLIGRDGEQFPELVRRIVAHGNEIADHTLTHPDLDRLDDPGVRAEIAQGADELSKIAADPALRTLVRPPHGRYREATLRVAQAAGYTTVLWNDDPGDWRDVTADQLQAHILAHATAPEILLLHSGRLATIVALPAIVARYRAAGYRFVTVGQLLARVPSDALNHPAKNRLAGA